MKPFKTIFLLTLILMMSNANAQDLKSHQWENRIVLLLTKDLKDTSYKRQVSEFYENEYGLNDRKIIVYHITLDAFKKGLKGDKWQKGTTKFMTYKKSNSPFEVILIGLDGGIKLQQSEFLTAKKLFEVIDVMPMRKDEMSDN